MQDKRESRRTGFNLKIEMIQKEGDQRIELLRANIGWGGVGGYTRDPVQEGSEVSVQIFFTDRSGATISETLLGRVVWAHRDGNFNALGVAFSAFDTTSHPRLFSYLQYTDQFN